MKLSFVYKTAVAALCTLGLAVSAGAGEGRFPDIELTPLDEYTRPALEPGEKLFSQSWGHFQNNLSATVSSPAGTSFEQEPRLDSLDTRLAFVLPHRVEADLRLKHLPSSEYEQKNPNTTSPATGKFVNDGIYDYSLGFAKRFERAELFARFSGMDMTGAEAQATSQPQFAAQGTMATHYLNHRYGLNYLSAQTVSVSESEFARIRGPLLPKKDFFVQLETGYQNGRANQGWTGLASTLSRQDTGFQRKLETSYWGSAQVTYGLRDSVQVKSGVLLSTPMEVFSEWLNDPRTSESRQAQIRSRTDRYVEIPFELRWRPADNMEAAFSSNSIYAHQKAAGATRAAGAAASTIRPDREVEYWNTKPRVELSWLLNPDNDSRGDYAERFEALTHKFLKKNEALVSLSYERDVTHHENGQDHGLASFVRPGSLFDRASQRHFFYGTEYSLRQDSALMLHTDGYGNAAFQNDDRFEVSVNYGFTDKLNVSFLAGYRSGSAVHLNVLPWTTPAANLEGWETESFVTKPYVYFDFGADWKIRENMILSFGAHWVPEFELAERKSTDGGAITDIDSSYLETLLALTMVC